jgi:hypothetical protein
MISNNMPVLTPRTLDQHGAAVVRLLGHPVRAARLARPTRKRELVARLFQRRCGGACVDGRFRERLRGPRVGRLWNVGIPALGRYEDPRRGYQWPRGGAESLLQYTVHWAERHGCGAKGRDAIGREVKDGRHREVGVWHGLAGPAAGEIAGAGGSWKKVPEGTKQRVFM